MFAAAICERLEIDRVVVPVNSSVFSAFGLLLASFVRRYSRSLDLSLVDQGIGAEMKQASEEMVAIAHEEAAAGGIDPAACELGWNADLRFLGQTFEIAVPLQEGAFDADRARALAESFPERYEATYGKGTAWEGSPVMLTNLNLTVVAERPVPELRPVPTGDEDPLAARRGVRRVLMPGGGWKSDVPIFDGPSITPGMRVAAPAIIDEHDTTLFVPPGWLCERDELFNYRLERSR
jgi:N-methylhydantoinase A